jgi:hypothetical protein
MRLIILATLFVIPLIGFASFPVQITIPSDTTIETKKETMEEYKARIEKQLYNNSEEIDVAKELESKYGKRKKFIISLNSNISSNQEYEQNQSFSFGRLIGNNFLLGGGSSSNGDIYLITRIYFLSAPLYITAKRSLNGKRKGNYFKGGIGYEFFINKSISLNSEVLFYSFLKNYTQTTYTLTSDNWGWPGLEASEEHIHENHAGGILNIGLQIHF